MPDSPLARLLDAARRRLLDRGARPTPDAERRQFFRRAGLGAAALGTGLLLPDEAWAGAQERAAAHGITPGTVVDAQGRPVQSSGIDPFIGEIMMTGWNFAARGWALCQGQILAISTNSALFSLLGTTFGGDGVQTFALPNLQGRVPIAQGTGPGLTPRTMGQSAGTEQTTLTVANLAAHNHPHDHTLQATTNAATVRSPNGAIPALVTPAIYGPASTPDNLVNTAPTNSGTSMTGGSQPFSIMQPFLVVNFQIALQGIFPSRN